MSDKLTYNNKVLAEGWLAYAIVWGVIALIFLTGFFLGVALS